MSRKPKAYPDGFAHLTLYFLYELKMWLIALSSWHRHLSFFSLLMSFCHMFVNTTSFCTFSVLNTDQIITSGMRKTLIALDEFAPNLPGLGFMIFVSSILSSLPQRHHLDQPKWTWFTNYPGGAGVLSTSDTTQRLDSPGQTLYLFSSKPLLLQPDLVS